MGVCQLMYEEEGRQRSPLSVLHCNMQCSMSSKFEMTSLDDFKHKGERLWFSLHPPQLLICESWLVGRNWQVTTNLVVSFWAFVVEHYIKDFSNFRSF